MVAHTAPDPPPPPDRAFAAFHCVDYRYYAASRFLATTAVQMQSVAVGYQLFALTGRPLDLGFVGLAQFLPVFLLSLASGQVADRVDRRRLLLACDLVYVACSIALASMTRAGAMTAGGMYLVLAAVGAARAFYGPAASALMPSLVPSEDFGNAAAWNSTVWQIAAIGGPTIGGMAYAATGSGYVVYVASACCFAVAGGLMLFVRGGRLAPVAGEDPAARPTLRTVFAGIRYVARARVLLGSISLDFLAVFFGGAVAMLPVYATAVLHADARALGLLRAAPAVGAGIMALVLAFRPIRSGAGVKMLACVGLFGVATVVFALSTSVAVSLVALGVLGAADMVSVVVRMTLEQAATPPRMRGRVSAVNMLFVGASNELGQFESGVAADLLGVVPSVVAGGVATLVVVALWSVFFPALRAVDRAEAVQPELEADPDP